MTPELPATVGRLLDESAERLAAAGLGESRREARRVLTDIAELLGHPVGEDRSAPAPAELAQGVRTAVGRRARGEPLAYATGLAGFRRLTLRVDRRVLIPRPETEGLVELVLTRVRSGTVVDVGTGSGCIALALADEGAFALVAGIDRSADALGVARENQRRTGLPAAFLRGDLLEAIAPASADAVVSNPPYLTEREYRELDASVKAWEPRGALPSGEDGLEATRRLVGSGLRVVRPGGWLALEVDASRAGAVAGLAGGAGWREVAVHMDLFGRARFVLARRNEAE